jgi:DNA-binding MarR family transcriptional regulator
MKETGLVNKVKDLEKKNLIRIELTSKGRKAYKQALTRESIHKVMSCLSEEERRQLDMLLEKLCRKTVEELGLKRKPPFLR